MILVLVAMLGVMVYFALADRTAARRPGFEADAVMCKRCGYDTRGLPGGVCPECGGDLSIVGTIAAARRRWPRSVALVVPVAWTLLVSAASALVLVPALNKFGIGRRAADLKRAVTVTEADDEKTTTGPPFTYLLTASGADFYWRGRRPRHAMVYGPALVVVADGAVDGVPPLPIPTGPHLKLNPSLQAATLESAAGQPPGPAGRFDAASLRALSAASAAAQPPANLAAVVAARFISEWPKAKAFERLEVDWSGTIYGSNTVTCPGDGNRFTLRDSQMMAASESLAWFCYGAYLLPLPPWWASLRRIHRRRVPRPLPE